jgi:hypothetical protein
VAEARKPRRRGLQPLPYPKVLCSGWIERNEFVAKRLRVLVERDEQGAFDLEVGHIDLDLHPIDRL